SDGCRCRSDWSAGILVRCPRAHRLRSCRKRRITCFMFDSYSRRSGVRASLVVVLSSVMVACVGLSPNWSSQAANGTNATNNASTSAPQGQLGQLNGTNQTNGTGSGNAVAFAKSLKQMSTSRAKAAVRNNSSKAAIIIEKVGSEYPGNTTQQLLQNPKQVASLYLGLVGKNRPGRGDNNGGGGGGGDKCSVTNPGGCIPSPDELISGF